ncbi:MAG: hypothetical protein HYV26_09145 [Candidatus Hydrogenedentes bacterium]|nr:hypothetical protein [Candidatus Hydrogenedentota bacterium]
MKRCSVRSVSTVGCARAQMLFWGVSAVIAALSLAGCPPTTPPDVTPPGPVTGFTATPGDAEVVLAWNNPGDSDLAGVRIQRQSGTPPATHTEGATIFNGMGATHTDTTAANGTEYFYAAFAYDTSGNFATGARASATPQAANVDEDISETFLEINEEIGKVPDNIYAPNQRGILIGLLEEAEKMYQSGDPCGSGETLQELLTEFQRLRAGNAIETSEEFYNSTRMLRYDMLLSIEAKAICPGAERVGFETMAEPEEESNKEVIAVARFGEPRVQTVRVQHELGGAPMTELFTQLSIPGTDGDLGDPGKPAVPIYRTLIAAPMSDVEVKITKQEFDVAETIKMNLYPTQEQPVDQNEIDPEFADRPFVKDPRAYATDDPYPPNPVTIQHIGDARDLKIYLVEIAAGQYHAKSSFFDVFTDIRVQTTFEGGDGAFITEASLDPFESGTPVYTNAVLNKNSVLQYIGPALVARIFGEELMIMTHPNFVDAAIALRDHKRANGIKEEIDAFIENHYATVTPRPSYILFLGDAEFIAPFYVGGIGTDWPYAILGTVGVDTIPDFGVGRIPVDTLEQANVVVDKIMDYEDSPPAAAAFYANASLASQFQCCRSGVAAGTDQRTFIQVSEFARNVMANAGKTVQRIYTETSPTATPARYYDGSLLPAAIGAASGFPWDGDTADIIAAYNAGRFFVMHRDHGWEEGWSHPEFELPHIDSLTNGAQQPVVFSVNCASGFWDNETAGGAYGTTVAGVYWAEKMLRKADGGAVGLLGDTRNSPSWANSTLTQGFFDAIWPNAIASFGGASSKKRLGDILNHGKLYLCSKIGFSVMGEIIDGSSATNELYLWHVLGDPTMKIRTNSPYNIVLSPEVKYRVLSFGVNLEYPENGTEFTVFEVGPTGGDPLPIGRGVVENGAATIRFNRERNPNMSLQFIASLDDSLAVEIEGKQID